MERGCDFPPPSIISKDNLYFAIRQGLTKNLSLTSLKKSLKGTYQKKKKKKWKRERKKKKRGSNAWVKITSRAKCNPSLAKLPTSTAGPQQLHKNKLRSKQLHLISLSLRNWETISLWPTCSNNEMSCWHIFSSTIISMVHWWCLLASQPSEMSWLLLV